MSCPKRSAISDFHTELLQRGIDMGILELHDPPLTFVGRANEGRKMNYIGISVVDRTVDQIPRSDA